MPNILDILRYIQQRHLIQQQQAQSQFQQSLAGATPGETYGQLGLSPDILKKALGRVPTSDEIARPMTAKDVMDKKVQEMLSTASPDLIKTLATTTAATQAGAPSALYTPTGVTTSAKTNEVEAGTSLAIAQGTQKSKLQAAIYGSQAQAAQNQTLADAVAAGGKAFVNLPTEVKGTYGLKTLFGQTPEQLQNGEVSAALDTIEKREALKATADPNHPLNQFFRSIGVDPAAGMGLLGMGAGQLLVSRIDMLSRLSIIGAEKESALEKGNIDAATDVAKKFGVSVNEVLNQWNMINQGKQPNTTLGRALQQGMIMNMQAGIVDAASKGDPDAARIAQMAAAVPKLANDPTALKEMDSALRTNTAKLLLKLRGVPTPSPDDAAGMDKYNRLVQALTTTLSSFGTSGWISKDINFQPAPTAPTVPADQTGTGLLTPPGGALAPQATPTGSANIAQPGATPGASGLTPQQQAAAQQLMSILGLQNFNQPAVPTPQP